MAFAFTETAGGLVDYRERLSPWVRAFIAVIGLAMFIIPIPFVQHGAWRTPTAGTLLAAAGAAAGVLAGVALLAIALAGSRHLRFDTPQRRLLLTTQGPLGRRRTSIGYDRIERVEVVRREAVDDPPFYLVVLTVAGRRPFELGGFARRDDAEHWRQRIAAQTDVRGRP